MLLLLIPAYSPDFPLSIKQIAATLELPRVSSRHKIDPEIMRRIA